MKKIISIIFLAFWALSSTADDTVMADSSTGVVTHPANFASSNSLATTSYVDSAIAALDLSDVDVDLSNYYNITQTNSAISSALTSYYTKTQTTTAITEALTSYYTKTQTNSAITTATSGLASTAYVDSAISSALDGDTDNDSSADTSDTPELYLIYNTSSLTNERVDFETTSAMKTWISANKSSLTGSLTAVRKNVDDGFTNFSNFFGGASGNDLEAYVVGCVNLTSIDLSDFDIASYENDYSNNIKINEMFANCTSLKVVDLHNLSPLTYSAEDVFYGCESLLAVYYPIEFEQWFSYTIQSSTTIFASADTVVYVPLNELDSYKSANSSYASQIKGFIYPEYPSSEYTLSVFIDLYRDGMSTTAAGTYYNNTSVYASYYSDVILKVVSPKGELLYYFSTILYDSDAVQSMHDAGIYDSDALVYYMPTGRINSYDIYGELNRLRPKMQFPSDYWEDYCIATFEELYSGQAVYNGITTLVDEKIRITGIQIYPSPEFYHIFLNPENTILVNRQTTVTAEVDGNGDHLFRPAQIQYLK